MGVVVAEARGRARGRVGEGAEPGELLLVSVGGVGVVDPGLLAGGAADLGALGDKNTGASAISADGSVVVGTATTTCCNEAWRATGGGPVSLGFLPDDTNSSATASNTSGSTNDSNIKKFAPAGSLPRQRSMPMANSVPSGTVIRVAITPSLTVCSSAVCSASLCHTDNVLSPQYHREEKPCHVVRDLPSLNE